MYAQKNVKTGLLKYKVQVIWWKTLQTQRNCANVFPTSMVQAKDKEF